MWLAAPWVPAGAPPSLGSLEHLFLFAPLVVTPLALWLLSTLLAAVTRSGTPVHRLARYAQPLAAVLVLASFYFPSGPIAGGLAAGWVLVAALVAVGGVGRAARLKGPHLAQVSLIAAHVGLPIGAGWLMLSRLGIAPGHLGLATVLLATLHFHFSGFALQVLIAATGLRLSDRGSRVGMLHRALSIGAVAGIPLIAAGNIGGRPVLKFAGVSAMVLSTIALAVTASFAARQAPDRPTRLLLLVSSSAIAAAMIVAGVYGLGELTGRPWITVSRMVTVHGVLNALGFTLFGLLGHLRWPSAR